MGEAREWVRWAAIWRSDGIDGPRTHIIGHMGIPALFCTRREARSYIAKHYGYIKDRTDLQVWPHGWKLPVPGRVTIAATTPRHPGADEGTKP